MSRLRIPEPGDIYDRWDGESILVTGLVIDEDGSLCVEFETSDPNVPAGVCGLGEWLGSARESGARPPPPRHTFAESDIEALEEAHEPTRTAKQTVLDKALEDGKPSVPSVGGGGSE